MSFIHHFLRIIWANIIGAVYALIYALKKDADYKNHLKEWNRVQNISQLADFFRKTYGYKWDGPKGLFDHNNFKREFFSSFGDCEDAAWYAMKKLKQIYGDNLELCSMFGFADLSAKPKFWHYDCIFKFRGNDVYFLFNYGRIQSDASLDGLKGIMEGMYASKYEFKKLEMWKCLWR